ncbi:HAAS signaling domain-containing protein [Ruicaihuangia caeni]|uniref:HAAS signaling domain-containing protein n=1 Tax=Ruicaihuangia caeni TaxID=3042517 RepID=UPI0033901D36
MSTPSSELPRVTRSYLAELDVALEGLPESVRRDIRAGVEEELLGADAATAAERIELLGDPQLIAANAREEAAAGSAVAAPDGAAAGISAQPLSAASDGRAEAAPGGLAAIGIRGFELAAVLLVAVGGFVVPFFGWVVGIVLVWMSRVWRTWEKLVATFGAAGAVLLGIAAAWVQRLADSEMDPGVNPLVPAAFDLWWSVFLLWIPVNVVLGIWLIVRARSRARENR